MSRRGLAVESGTPMGPHLEGDFSQAQVSDRTAADILVLEELATRHAAERRYPLWRVHLNGRPISVRVHRQEGAWLAESSWLNICGTGDNRSAAIAGAEQHIRHFVHYYASISEDKLIGKALELKVRFRQVALMPDTQ